jgi:hypothetical protein
MSASRLRAAEGEIVRALAGVAVTCAAAGDMRQAHAKDTNTVAAIRCIAASFKEPGGKTCGNPPRCQPLYSAALEFTNSASRDAC